ncbi:MAG: hypothetical protein OTJ98_09595 [Dehalococcoidia bacterium]|nr:hypothetical protein [Dehalococcoidia bacterium]
MNPQVAARIGQRRNRSNDLLETKLTCQRQAGADLVRHRMKATGTRRQGGDLVGVAVVATKLVTPKSRSAPARHSKGCGQVPKTSRAGNADHGGRTRKGGHALNGSHGVAEINTERMRRKVAEAAQAGVKHDLRIQGTPEGTPRHQRRWTSVLRSRTPEAVFKTMTVRRAANLAI